MLPHSTVATALDCSIISTPIGFVPGTPAERTKSSEPGLLSNHMSDWLLTLPRCADTMNLLVRVRVPACRVPVV